MPSHPRRLRILPRAIAACALLALPLALSPSTTPTIKKAFVFRPQQTAADPDQKD